MGRAWQQLLRGPSAHISARISARGCRSGCARRPAILSTTALLTRPALPTALPQPQSTILSRAHAGCMLACVFRFRDASVQLLRAVLC